MFELTQDHEDFRKLVREFAEAEIAPHIAEWDRTAYFPVELMPKMGELGLFGLVVPEEYGGGAGEGGEFTYLCIAIEELGRVDQAMGITLEAGEWVVNGSKSFITNSGSSITSVVTVTARTGTRDNGTPEISAIMIPSGTPGFTAEQPYHKLGWHCSDTHGLSFDNVRVPEANLLGQRGKGFAQFLATLDDGRIAIAALALGCVQRMLEEATAYSKSRLAFGKPIGTYQGVSFQVADLAVMAETSRLLVYKAAWLKDEMAAGRRSMQEVKQAASIAKLYTSEAAVTATRIATQIFGGNGFMEEYPVARFYRDAKILSLIHI